MNLTQSQLDECFALFRKAEDAARNAEKRLLEWYADAKAPKVRVTDKAKATATDKVLSVLNGEPLRLGEITHLVNVRYPSEKPFDYRLVSGLLNNLSRQKRVQKEGSHHSLTFRKHHAI